ncbi:CaiB/BaiF CoA transferase family protein [Rhodococcus koreensis]
MAVGTRGPLEGLRVVELASIGPGPHAALVLADLGADVVRVERPAGGSLQIGDAEKPDMGMRGRRSISADLKTEAGREVVLGLAAHADILIEGMRPGVAERLGVGPDECFERNPGLVYGRVTGYGQDGPMASAVGHDINYVGLTGALHAMGKAGAPPIPPLNLVGDYGGGSMLLLVGLLAALHERSRSGRGQVVDSAMVDGVTVLSQMLLALRATDGWNDERESNLLDGAAPFYCTYECADRKYVAVGALEPQFFRALVEGLQLDPAGVGEQHDRENWPRMREIFETTFRSRTRDEWVTHFSGQDACVTPVNSFREAAENDHLRARGAYVEVDGVWQAGPAPHFSRTPPATPTAPPAPGSTEFEEVLAEWSRNATPRP